MTTYSFTVVEGYSYSGYLDYSDDGPEPFEGSSVTSYTGSVRVDEGETFTVSDGELAAPSLDWVTAFSYEDKPYYYDTLDRAFSHDVMEVTWDGGSSIVYRVTYDYVMTDSGFYNAGTFDSWIVLDGTALPAFATYDDFRAFIDDATITDPGADYDEGSEVDLGTLPGVSVSENDVIEDSYDSEANYGGAGNDLFQVVYWDGPDLFDGGTGTDTVSYEWASTYGITVINLTDSDRNAGAAEGDRYVSIENAIGGYDDDRITGTAGDNRLRGEDGDDVLIGAQGDDVLRGGDGDDLLDGGAGADRLDGGDGWDRATYARATDRMTIDMADGAASSRIARGDTFENIEVVEAGAGDDVLRGDHGDNRLLGGTGDDVIRGRDGDDDLFGQAGDDRLNGDAGDDYLNGGAGSDTFEFTGGHDVIADLTDIDTLLIANRFASGAQLTARDIEDAAEIVDGTLVLSFGPAHSLTLVGYDTVEDILALTGGY